MISFIGAIFSFLVRLFMTEKNGSDNSSDLGSAIDKAKKTNDTSDVESWIDGNGD